MAYAARRAARQHHRSRLSRRLARPASPSWPTIIDEAGFPEIARARRRVVFRALNRLADEVVVVSEGLGDFMEQQEGAPRAKIRFVPNCGKPEYFRTPKTNFDTPDRPFKVCVVGRLVEVKNHEVLIDVLAHLPPDTRPQLHLFGDGPLRDTIVARAQAATVADNVIVHGYVSGSTADQLRDMNVYAIPPLAEGCSLALIEAMALGLPVLASFVQGNIEVVAALGEQWMVAPDDVSGWAAALSRMQAMSPEARRAHGEAGRQRAQDHIRRRPMWLRSTGYTWSPPELSRDHLLPRVFRLDLRCAVSRARCPRHKQHAPNSPFEAED